MEDPAPVAPVTQKRSLEDEVEPPVTPVKPATDSQASTPLSVLSVETPSPLRSSAQTSTGPGSNKSANGQAPSPQNASTSTSTQQPAKRRKFTSQEKEAQRLDKEAKAKAREEKKAQKEAEDRLKAEQKAQKDEEKRKKNEERDEKKRLKEEEQQRLEEEKAKKARSQMKLNAFFVKPKTGSSPSQAVVASSQTPIAPTSLPDRSGASTDMIPPSPQKTIVKNAQTDYERYFLPFNVPPHTILAPTNTFLGPEQLEVARSRLESTIARRDGTPEPITREALMSLFPKRNARGHQTATIAEVVDCVNRSSDNPIDITIAKSTASRHPLEMLREIPMKYIHFCKDVRPPYYGTYTKPYTNVEAARLARNPISRTRQDTDYDYDSEAEWDEPEEGEDLDSDGEDDNEEDADDDMDGFLDDEEDPQLKRGLISGDLLPVSTGLCWEDTERVSRLNDGSDAICTDFKDFRMGFLLDPHMQSIDPFSTAYWAPDPATLVPGAAVAKKENSTNGAMDPPRAPLTQRTMNGLLNTLNGPQKTPAGTSAKPAKAKRMIPPEQLPAFKAEIEGKDLTKIGMIESLKKVFPKLPKDAITNTLSVVAARVGPTEKEKRWVVINT
ncbi:chromatin assembly factor 1 subunit a [Stemphylium lycopersici]|uniref:Chromatin assembly factor 1 subunit a n=1 Tax=Stemphylium lycopersici TaxID=183478 RepID=A0A364MYU9_STELY|nr:chromatin assembly factor 1 subunit a [Stemphylium lycopersici]RAR07354.1 chromatin assembly factor 1 subunit a [Stemphylium lycopersici]